MQENPTRKRNQRRMTLSRLAVIKEELDGYFRDVKELEVLPRRPREEEEERRCVDAFRGRSTKAADYAPSYGIGNQG